MKRLFWLFLGAFAVGIVSWLFTRRQMDSLYGEVSRLREVERKHKEMLDNVQRRSEAFREGIHDMAQENTTLPNPTPEQKMRMAMKDAVYKAHARESLGENFIDDDEEADA